MLYNEERPASFSELLGQDANKEVFLNQIKNGTFSHAYLFYGHHGCGKTTVARLLAKAAVCENLSEDGPCNECSGCKSIDSNSVDFIEIDAASNTGVDAIREKIIEAVKYKPVQDKKKRIIIDEVHMLSTSAFNALLKTLEEPPKDVIFFLCTTELEKVPKTIVSRCQKFEFRAIGKEDIVKGLKRACENHNINIEEPVLEMIAECSNGAMRDALSILDQFKDEEKVTSEQVAEVLGKGKKMIVSQIVDAIENGTLREVNDKVDEYLSSSSTTSLVDSLVEELLNRALKGTRKLFSLMEQLSLIRKEVTPIRLKALLISHINVKNEVEALKERVRKLETLVYDGVVLETKEDTLVEKTSEEISMEEIPEEVSTNEEVDNIPTEEVNNEELTDEPMGDEVGEKNEFVTVEKNFDGFFATPFDW